MSSFRCLMLQSGKVNALLDLFFFRSSVHAHPLKYKVTPLFYDAVLCMLRLLYSSAGKCRCTRHRVTSSKRNFLRNDSVAILDLNGYSLLIFLCLARQNYPPPFLLFFFFHPRSETHTIYYARGLQKIFFVKSADYLWNLCAPHKIFRYLSHQHAKFPVNSIQFARLQLDFAENSRHHVDCVLRRVLRN